MTAQERVRWFHHPEARSANDIERRFEPDDHSTTRSNLTANHLHTHTGSAYSIAHRSLDTVEAGLKYWYVRRPRYDDKPRYDLDRGLSEKERRWLLHACMRSAYKNGAGHEQQHRNPPHYEEARTFAATNARLLQARQKQAHDHLFVLNILHEQTGVSLCLVQGRTAERIHVKLAQRLERAKGARTGAHVFAAARRMLGEGSLEELHHSKHRPLSWRRTGWMHTSAIRST